MLVLEQDGELLEIDDSLPLYQTSFLESNDIYVTYLLSFIHYNFSLLEYSSSNSKSAIIGTKENGRRKTINEISISNREMY